MLGHPVEQCLLSRRKLDSRDWPMSGTREDDESLGCSGHCDIAVDRSFDARAERLWVDEDGQVELEPFDSSAVSDRTRDVAWKVPSARPSALMTQAIPSAFAASQVSRTESSSDVDPCTTGTSLLRMEVGTLASGSTARMTGSAPLV